MLKYLTVFILCLCGINGQILDSNGCPDLPVQNNFNLEKFLGKWYERMLYTAGPGGDSCNLDTYTLNENGSFDLSMTDLSDWVVSGRAKPVSEEAAKFVLSFSVGANSDLPYWILKTDYNSYAVAWTCLDIPYSSLRYIWVLTRDRTSAEELNEALSTFPKLNIDTTYLKGVNQYNCSN